MARALLLHNPAARNAPDPALLKDFARELSLAGFDTEIAASLERGDLTHLAKAAQGEGFDRVVVCGGDGSVREAAHGLIGRELPLAIIPMGTANVLAREMALPLGSPTACAAVAGRGCPRPIGLGTVNGLTFTFCASAGPDSIAVGRLDPLEKGSTGPWAYIHAAMTGLIDPGPPALRVHLPGGRTLDAFQVFAARARHYGGPFRVSASARLESPLIRLLAVSPTLAGSTILLPCMLGEGIEGVPGVTALDVEAFDLTSDAPCPVQADGDVIARTPARFESHPKALQLVFPC